MTKSQHSIFNQLCNEAFADDHFERFTDADVELLTDLHLKYQDVNELSEDDYRQVRAISVKQLIKL